MLSTILRSPLAYLIAIALLMVVLNPSRSQHQDKVVETFCEDNPVSCALGLGKAGKHFIKYESFGLFSVGRIDGEKEPVSIGVLGVVVARDLEIDLI